MPDPKDYTDKDTFISACIPMMIKDKGMEQDQASAACFSMWERRDKAPMHAQARIFSNQFREVVKGGKKFLVVPGVPVREQVMNTYFVPGEEISKSIQNWNGTAISIQHPKQNGGSVKVPEPDVAIIGQFYGAQWDAPNMRMTGEYWIDIAEAEKWEEGKQILNAVRGGKVLETSTGYYADEDPTSGEWHGRGYQTIHRHLMSDHIAILPNQVGACSVTDGCGVNRNEAVHNCEHDPDCNCPFKIKANAEVPAYVPNHLPRVMMEGYAFNKGTRTQEQIDGLRAHMQANGIDKPCHVMRLEDGNLRVLDGNHRIGMAGEMGIDQIPVKVYDHNMQPMDPEALYTEWSHKMDQSYLNALQDHPKWSQAEYDKMHAKGMTDEEIKAMWDKMGTNKNSESRPTTSPAVTKNDSKESSMDEKLLEVLRAQGVTVTQNEAGEYEVAMPQTQPAPTAAAADVPGLSADEIQALKDLAHVGTVLNELGPEGLAALKDIKVVKNFAAQAAGREKAERDGLIAQIKTNAANPYTDEELAGMTSPVLAKLNGQLNINYSPMSGGGSMFTNSEDVLGLPTSLLITAKESGS